MDDNFFMLGGHSLQAMMLMSRMHKEFEIQVQLREIFKAPTVGELAEYVKTLEKIKFFSIQPADEREYYPVSSAQKRMYILNQLEEKQTSYNITGMAILEGRLDPEHFEEVIKTLIRRHEAFRTSFSVIDGMPVQIIHRDVDFKMGYMDADEEKVAEMEEEFIRPFDLNQAPLVRIDLVRTAENRHVMFSDMHHIISDGVSMDILITEMGKLYRKEELPDLRIQYKDFSVWQNGLSERGIIHEQEKYWRGVFNKEIPVLNLPVDYPRPVVQSFEGDSISLVLDMQLSRGLKRLAGEMGTTLYMLLLAAYNVLLSKYTGQEDIVVGTPIAGRQHADSEGILGIFVNTLAMRNYPSGEKTFKEFLKEVRKNCIKAYENQDYQFEELIEKLNIQKDLGRNPLFDTMFMVQNNDICEMEMGDLRFIPYNFDNKTAKFDITVEVTEKNEEIRLGFNYSTRLFKRETIERFGGHFVNIMARGGTALHKTFKNRCHIRGGGRKTAAHI